MAASPAPLSTPPLIERFPVEERYVKNNFSFYYWIVLPLIGVVRFYQLVISPFLGPKCRFHPTCSDYALQALKGHGLIHGLALIVRRLTSCRPGGRFGYDPVPKKVGVKSEL